ncbi:MAG: doxX-like family protein [Anaerosporomusa subterranea]|jgi:CDGSH-type Zn-finger protein/uncharacterized membrane protein YphA (DoxX/SURF4 family)|nr:doxX-like family protein [Anaerosporomusa subterranea]
MIWATRIIQGLLAIAFLLSGSMKLSGNPEQAAMFSGPFGYSVGFMYVVGVIEVLSAIGLIVGLWRPRLSIIPTGVLLVTMAGAVFTHLRAGQGIGAAVPSLTLLLLSAILLALLLRVRVVTSSPLQPACAKPIQKGDGDNKDKVPLPRSTTNDVAEIKVINDGPNLVLSKDAEVIDAQGNRFKTGEQWALCRCGLSKNMPFCDGSHQGKFSSSPKAK